MLKKLSTFWEKLNKTGIYLPLAHDPNTDQPSITLLFYWLTVLISIISLISLHFNHNLLQATLTSILFVVIGFITYRLRKLDKIKIDIKNQSIDLEDNSEKDNK